MDSSSDLSDPPSSDPPSSPLSELSKSPTLSPRARYPSPLSTAPSGSASPLKMSDPAEADSICVNPDGARPAKRRKIEKKPRTTEHLDLRAGYSHNEDDEDLVVRLTSALRQKKKIVVIAGAGISVSAGIPDFRSSNGLFRTLKSQHKLKASGKQLFDASVYKHNDSTESFHDMVRELSHQTKKAKPSPFHHMIASIAEEGRLLRLYTQNVDGIDTAMPPLSSTVPLAPLSEEKGSWPKTVQLHGGLEKMVCSKCSELYDFDGSLFNGPEPPPCPGCTEIDNVRTSHAGKRSHGVGRLRPRMVLYNEHNPDQDAITKVIKADTKTRPDAVVVVGTSMKIPGVRKLVQDLCYYTRLRRDGLTVWINLDSEPSGADLKDCWDMVVQGKCDDVATLVGLPHWDESPALGHDVKVDEKQFEEVKQTLRSTELEVQIPRSPDLSASSVKDESRATTPIDAKPQMLAKVRGIPTPTASPKMRTALPVKAFTKSKQSQLVFPPKSKVSSSAAPAVKELKEPKKRERKPPQSKKAESKPKTTIKNSFKATKAQVATSTKNPTKIPAKRSLEPDQPVQTDARSLWNSDFSLRPSAASRQQKGSPGLDALKDEAVITKKRESERTSQGGPTTPTQPGRANSTGSETISPPSKPRGLAEMID
ncbi:putative Deacetylase sirtuin-type domain-containing protein [Seiridium unicorne]|uniref:Deacetylase sirtuin-type domain-containing protein n=1 Tax=Seiridium unicorne TaxID=138068 RepID=A0ABR2VDP1_9PEZI